jgi:DNA-binding MarR family transcriptional regulator
MAERRPDPTDRRAKLVAITDAGLAGLDVANATRQRLLTHIFGALSEADRATLLRLLDGLDEAAQQLIAAPAASAAPVASTAPSVPA